MASERKNKFKKYIKNHPYDFVFLLISGLTAFLLLLSFPLWLLFSIGSNGNSSTALATLFSVSSTYPAFWIVLLFLRHFAKKEPAPKIRNFMVNTIQVALVLSWLVVIFMVFNALIVVN